ncbi:MAG: hypothetical protein CMN58_03170 [Solibacterales bacterium]|nr:hypothetical protein [Bryobacterales bacterium]
MKTNVLILSLVLLLNFAGLANGGELDSYGGFKEVVGERTGFFIPKRSTDAGGWSPLKETPSGGSAWHTPLPTL